MTDRAQIEQQLIEEAHRQLGGKRPVCLDMLSDAYDDVCNGQSIKDAAHQLVIDTLYWDGDW